VPELSPALQSIPRITARAPCFAVVETQVSGTVAQGFLFPLPPNFSDGPGDLTAKGGEVGTQTADSAENVLSRGDLTPIGGEVGTQTADLAEISTSGAWV